MMKSELKEHKLNAFRISSPGDGSSIAGRSDNIVSAIFGFNQ